MQLAADTLSRRKSKLPANLYRLSAANSDHDEEDAIDDLQLQLTALYPDPVSERGWESDNARINSVMREDKVTVITWERLYKAVQEDPLLVKLMEVVLRGFPQSSHDVDEDLKQYHRFRHDLHVAGGIVCYKDRAIIPVTLRPQVLEIIHAAHQGVRSAGSRRRSSGLGSLPLFSKPGGVSIFLPKITF